MRVVAVICNITVCRSKFFTIPVAHVIAYSICSVWQRLHHMCAIHRSTVAGIATVVFLLVWLSDRVLFDGVLYQVYD